LRIFRCKWCNDKWFVLRDGLGKIMICIFWVNKPESMLAVPWSPKSNLSYPVFQLNYLLWYSIPYTKAVYSKLCVARFFQKGQKWPVFTDMLLMKIHFWAIFERIYEKIIFGVSQKKNFSQKCVNNQKSLEDTVLKAGFSGIVFSMAIG